MNDVTVLLNCFDFTVNLSIKDKIQDFNTLSVITSEHREISFSKTKSSSSFGLYDIYTTKFDNISLKKYWISNGGYVL